MNAPFFLIFTVFDTPFAGCEAWLNLPAGDGPKFVARPGPPGAAPDLVLVSDEIPSLTPLLGQLPPDRPVKVVFHRSYPENDRLKLALVEGLGSRLVAPQLYKSHCYGPVYEALMHLGAAHQAHDQAAYAAGLAALDALFATDPVGEAKAWLLEQTQTRAGLVQVLAGNRPDAYFAPELDTLMANTKLAYLLKQLEEHQEKSEEWWKYRQYLRKQLS